MPIVTIVKGFTFQHHDGFKELIPPGTYDLDDEMANHFYVRAHSDNPLPLRARPGMSQFEALTAGRGQPSDPETSRFKRAVMEPQTHRPNERPKLDEPAA